MYNTNPKFFCRPVRKNDLVMPDEARVVAREFGIHYYETSVLTYYGVNEVFENAIRAALISRRRQRFWMTNLKKVQRPLLQVGTTIRIYILIYRYRLLNVGKSIVHSSFAPKKVSKIFSCSCSFSVFMQSVWFFCWENVQRFEYLLFSS